MENDRKVDANKEHINGLKNVKSEDKSFIFSQNQINVIVRDFVTAYLRGDVVIKFKDATEIMMEGKLANRKVNVDSAISQEVAMKQPFIYLVSICSGSKLVTPEERQSAINKLFEAIVSLRSSERLQGTFMTSPSAKIEKRLNKLEQDVKETNSLVNEIAEFLRRKFQSEKS